MKALVIYHANCTDGFTAAYVFSQTRAEAYDEVEYLPWAYGSARPVESNKFLGKDVYILDFSFSRFHMRAFCSLAIEVTIIDHHKTAQADLENWSDRPANLNVIFDMTKSGAGLTWDTLAPKNAPRPNLVNYVEDRDLWKFALARSKDANAYINLKSRNFGAYKELEDEVQDMFGEVVEIGGALNAYHEQICESIASDLARPCVFTIDDNRIEGLIANCTGQFASEVGTILAKRSGVFGATSYTDAEGNLRVSLRSIGEFDVSVLAQLYGGGGHKNAAGFVIPADVSGNTNSVHFWRTDGKA